jgi:hypothetical protein
VIHPNEKVVPPQVQLLVAHGLHEADQLAFIGREFQVAHGEQPTEEGEGPRVLVEDSAEPSVEGVAINDEHLVEIRHLKHRPC